MSLVSPLTLHARDATPSAVRTGPGPMAKHFEALDGVRGIAILMVLFCHFSISLREEGWEGKVRDFTFYGYIGVTLFFVLSGFLITRILLTTRDDPGYFRTFYARRSLRIFPLYYAYVAFVFLVFKPLGAKLLGGASLDPARAWWYLTYLQNLEPFSARLNDGGIAHLWSLAIEEQFYLAWPLAVFVTPRRWLVPLCGVGFLASIGFRWEHFLAGDDLREVYQSTFSRMDALLAGAAIGAIELDEAARSRLSRHLKPIAAASLAVIAYFIATTGGLTSERVGSATIGWAALTIFFAAAVFWAATAGAGNRILCDPRLRAIGKYSYGMYVLHMLPVPVVLRLIPDATLAGRLAQVAVNLAITAGLTAASWHLLEAPFLRLKRAVRYAT